MISVLKKEDGFWLLFDSPTGKHALVTVGKLLTAARCSIIDGAILETCEECASKPTESAPSASTNTASLKLPTLAEVHEHVLRELWSTDMLATSLGITERVYNYMVRQLRAGA